MCSLLERWSFEVRFRLKVIDARKSARKSANSPLAIHAAGPAIPPKPSKAARRAMTKNAEGQLNITNHFQSRLVIWSTHLVHFHSERGVHEPFDNLDSRNPSYALIINSWCVHEVAFIAFVESPVVKLKRSQGGETEMQTSKRRGFAGARLDGQDARQRGDLAFCMIRANVPCKLRHPGSRNYVRASNSRELPWFRCQLSPRYALCSCPLDTQKCVKRKV